MVSSKSAKRKTFVTSDCFDTSFGISLIEDGALLDVKIGSRRLGVSGRRQLTANRFVKKINIFDENFTCLDHVKLGMKAA